MQARWARRRYFIRDGYIRPILGSEVTHYDPFEAYYGTDAARPGRSLYQQLVELDLDNERAIEDFVSAFGLLGLFQHRLIQARHVDCPVPNFADNPEVLPAGLFETVELTGLHPDDSSWYYEFTQETEPWRMGVAKNYKQWLGRTKHPYGSVIVENRYGWLEEVPRAEYYSHYFPDLPHPQAKFIPWPSVYEPVDDEDFPTYRELLKHPDLYRDDGWDYPRLSSPRLWDSLCEPLEEFRSAARALGEIYDLCDYVSSTAPPPEPPGDAPDSAWEPLYWDRSKRNDLKGLLSESLRRVHPIPRCSEDGASWSWSWAFPSLLSAAHAMLFLDFVVEGRKLRFCGSETCGKTFVTERSDRKYCSETCQNTQKQRDFRRARKAAADREKGEST